MNDWDSSKATPLLIAHLSSFKQAKMKDFASLLEPHMTRRQVRSLVDNLVSEGTLTKSGKGSGTVYYIGESFLKKTEILRTAISLGLKELQRISEGNSNVQNCVQNKSKGELEEK